MEQEDKSIEITQIIAALVNDGGGFLILPFNTINFVNNWQGGNNVDDIVRDAIRVKNEGLTDKCVLFVSVVNLPFNSEISVQYSFFKQLLV